MIDQSNITMNQYLTFSLGSGVFALDIAEVREVLELSEITALPRMPHYMLGVINLRGNAVPVMDMRQKLSMDRVDTTVDTCIIITEVELDNSRVLMGTLVDSVREVLEMLPEAIEPAPRMGSEVKADYIAGMGSINNEFIIILDIDKTFSNEELAEVLHVGDQATSDLAGKAA